MSVLRALNLAKSYKSRQVLLDLSLEVASGDVVGLLGPNGAGKTTAFYMIVGLAPCEHGEILLDDRNISRLPMHRRAQLGLGYLPQEPSVFRRLSVADNIMAILETRPGTESAARHARLEELLDELHIEHVRDSLGLSLSGGGPELHSARRTLRRRRSVVGGGYTADNQALIRQGNWRSHYGS
jgi:lipopolysaccharide export system ATP-binding protein